MSNIVVSPEPFTHTPIPFQGPLRLKSSFSFKSEVFDYSFFSQPFFLFLEHSLHFLIINSPPPPSHGWATQRLSCQLIHTQGKKKHNKKKRTTDLSEEEEEDLSRSHLPACKLANKQQSRHHSAPERVHIQIRSACLVWHGQRIGSSSADLACRQAPRQAYLSRLNYDLPSFLSPVHYKKKLVDYKKYPWTRIQHISVHQPSLTLSIFPSRHKQTIL